MSNPFGWRMLMSQSDTLQLALQPSIFAALMRSPQGPFNSVQVFILRELERRVFIHFCLSTEQLGSSWSYVPTGRKLQ